jgi:hypothetical protein
MSYENDEFIESIMTDKLMKENYKLESELATENYDIWTHRLFTIFSESKNDDNKLNNDILSNSVFRILLRMTVFTDELKNNNKELNNEIYTLKNELEVLRTDVDDLMTENYTLYEEKNAAQK